MKFPNIAGNQFQLSRISMQRIQEAIYGGSNVSPSITRPRRLNQFCQRFMGQNLSQRALSISFHDYNKST